MGVISLRGFWPGEKNGARGKNERGAGVEETKANAISLSYHFYPIFHTTDTTERIFRSVKCLLHKLTRDWQHSVVNAFKSVQILWQR